jgi:uncharacterized surface protein with fasciclin (FAS1) repeats
MCKSNCNCCCSKLDIVDTASNICNLTTFVVAIKAAGLVDALKGPGPFTVFAPTNEAFAKLPYGTLESLLKPENKASLTKILLYHVVSGEYEVSDLCKCQTLKSLEGSLLKINKVDCKPRVNCAKIKKCDICASNGIIQEINKVLIPPN